MVNPPIGFIIEGHGEFNCYPSLLCRIVGQSGFKVPRVNAGGCGSVVRILAEHLNDLLLVDNPRHIVVTVDLIDILRQGLAESHDDLIAKLNEQASRWREVAIGDPRLQPLPEQIHCLAQVQKFESWLIADVEGLKTAELVHAHIQQVEDAEVIQDPSGWLKRALVSDSSVKSPNFAKTVVSALDPERMKLRSASFSRFHDTCKSAHSSWAAEFA